MDIKWKPFKKKKKWKKIKKKKKGKKYYIKDMIKWVRIE